jgi:hypothetical protein
VKPDVESVVDAAVAFEVVRKDEGDPSALAEATDLRG